MREYILTDKERIIICKYLETGERLEGFSMLIHRCKHMETINKDIELIKQFLTKLS
jgi:hypothetical protein